MHAGSATRQPASPAESALRQSSSPGAKAPLPQSRQRSDRRLDIVVPPNDQLEKILSYIDIGKAGGAKLLAGGERDLDLLS